MTSETSIWISKTQKQKRFSYGFNDDELGAYKNSSMFGWLPPGMWLGPLANDHAPLRL